MLVFSYGSLTNPATHALRHVGCAQLTGWRRAWRHAPQRQVAYLTIVPDERASIAGVILEVPDAEKSGLAAREAAYDLVDVAHLVTPAPAAPVSAYAIAADRHGDPTPETPVLLSYIDVVVQGYLRMFGRTGVEAFFASTSGWDAPIVRDREAPLYPRHQKLSAQEYALVDAALAKKNVTFLDHIPSLTAAKEPR